MFGGFGEVCWFALMFVVVFGLGFLGVSGFCDMRVPLCPSLGFPVQLHWETIWLEILPSESLVPKITGRATMSDTFMGMFQCWLCLQVV